MGCDCKDSAWSNILDIESEYQLGHDVTIPPYGGLAGAGFGVPVDAVWARFKRPTTTTLTFWADPVGGPAPLVTVRSYVGNSRRFRTFPCPTVPTSMRVFGKQVTVSFQTSGASTTGHAMLSPDNTDPLGDLALLWVPSTGLIAGGLVAAPQGPEQLATTLGRLVEAQGYLATLGAGDAAEWVMFFDTTSGAAPINGVSPLIAIGPLTVNEPFSYGDPVRPFIGFVQGLAWWLSSTGGTFTAPGAGATARVDVGYGV